MSHSFGPYFIGIPFLYNYCLANSIETTHFTGWFSLSNDSPDNYRNLHDTKEYYLVKETIFMQIKETDSINLKRINEKQLKTIKDSFSRIQLGADNLFTLAQEEHDRENILRDKNSLPNSYNEEEEHILKSKDAYARNYKEEAAYERMLIELQENTASNQQAFFNILNHPELRLSTAYCRYANTYLIEQIELFHQKSTMEYISLSSTVHSLSDLGMITLYLSNSSYLFNRLSFNMIHPLWQGEKKPTVIHTDSLVLRYNREALIKESENYTKELLELAEEIAKNQEKIENLASVKFAWLPKEQKEKRKEELDKEINRATKRILHLYDVLLHVNDVLDSPEPTKEELEQEKEQIINEIKAVQQFLEEHLNIELIIK